MSEGYPGDKEAKEEKDHEEILNREGADDDDDDSSLSDLSDDDNGGMDLSDLSLAQLQMILNQSVASAEQQQALLQHFLAMMSIDRPLTDEERRVLASPVPQPLSSPDIAGVAKYILEGHAKNIIVMTFVAMTGKLLRTRFFTLCLFVCDTVVQVSV